MGASLMSRVLVKEAYTVLPKDATKADVIQLMTNSLAEAGKIKATDIPEITSGALAREERGSTGIGHGIAIPHCRTDLVDRIICAYGRCTDGLDFDSLDGEPVHSVFLLLTPQAQREEHLDLMRNFATQIRKEHFCQFLHKHSDAESLVALLTEFEDQ